jgi:chemotaxis protein CheZ
MSLADDDARNKLVEEAEALILSLQNHDDDATLQHLSNISHFRDNNLYQEVGTLTRELHSALKSFQQDIDSSGKTHDHEISEARDRLDYVIDLCEDAANKTMDGIEAALPHSEHIRDEAKKYHEQWCKFESREMSADEFRNLYKSMMDFLATVDQHSSDISSNLNDVLLAQEYQDLTGQIIKRVITLVTEVEARLVQLIRVASEAENLMVKEADHFHHSEDGQTLLNGIIESESNLASDRQAEGPSYVACNQDEVDDLLDSLGF